jgi:DNA-binding transcriptional regulator YiaG
MAKKKKIRVSDFKRRGIFGELKESLEFALAYERGQPVDLRVTKLPAPPRRLMPREIRKIRRALNASQSLFASLLNVSAKAVQSWEQGGRRPRSAALKLLAIASKNPRVLLHH